MSGLSKRVRLTSGTAFAVRYIRAPSLLPAPNLQPIHDTPVSAAL
jgi:hypothetical protein